MPTILAPIDALLPTQECVHHHFINKYLQAYQAGENVGPVRVIPLRDDEITENLILVDGHHRSYVRHCLGYQAVLADVCDTDDTIDLIYGNNPPGIRTLAEFRHRYTSLWLPNVTQHDVQHIRDLKVVG